MEAKLTDAVTINIGNIKRPMSHVPVAPPHLLSGCKSKSGVSDVGSESLWDLGDASTNRLYLRVDALL